MLTLNFAIRNGVKTLAFRMPADADKVYEYMRKQVSRPYRGTEDRLRQQAERTAWKLLQDSLEVEISRLKLQQTEFLQVFLPYVWDGEQTFYERLKAGGFKQLPERT